MLTENSSAPQILVVEADAEHVSAIKRSFFNAGQEYRLEIAATLHAARAAMAAHPPDLIIAGSTLPDGEGSTLLHAAAPPCPVVLMTAEGDESGAAAALNSGAAGCIVTSALSLGTLPLTVMYILATWRCAVSRGNAAEIARQKNSERELVEAKSKLLATFDAIPDLLFIVGLDGRYYEFHSPRSYLLAAPVEEFLGKTICEILPPAVAVVCMSAIQEAFTDGYSFGKQYELQLQQGKLWFELSVSQLQSGASEDCRFVVLARDITERRQAEEKRLLLEAQFLQSQKLESLGVLAGGIAHDFNNILTIIMGHCYIADEDTDSGINPKNHIKQIEKAAGRAADLCRQMLSYAGENSPLQSRINLWLLIDENVKMLQSAIKKNVVIERNLKFDVPEITGDSAQIQQVVMNLIINAAEAIGEHSGIVKIALNKVAVSADHAGRDMRGNAILPGSYACLAVSDNGCGMDNETQRRVFEPFFTTKFTGRGLGMSAVLGIVKSHHGYLQLSTAPGEGTTFKVYFPNSAAPDAVEAGAKATLAPAARCSGTVLMVDDEEAIRIIGAVLLKGLGFSPLTANNGREALEIFRERGREIDLVILDLYMPEMGGLDTYRALREMSPLLPIVISSGCKVEEVMKLVAVDGHAAVLQKPYSSEQLRNTLVRLIATRF